MYKKEKKNDTKNKNLVFFTGMSFAMENFYDPLPTHPRLMARAFRMSAGLYCGGGVVAYVSPIVVTRLKCIIYYETSASGVETKRRNIAGHYRVFTFPTGRFPRGYNIAQLAARRCVYTRLHSLDIIL